MRTFVLSLAVGWLLANASVAMEACKTPAACAEVQTCGSTDHCGRCGSCCACEKYCRVVRETKEIKKTVWVVKCEDFCVPLPNCGHGGCGGCEACKAAENCGAEPACNDGCGTKCDPCTVEKNKCIVPPKCGKVREKKTLEKKEIVCKVPSYKCVVVYCCPNCGAQECGAEKAPAAPASAPSKTTQNAPLPPLAATAFTK
jgi:hypothetical protein